VSRKLTTEEFITKAREVHGDKWDYSLVDYECATKPVKITCPQHGVFLQSPGPHVLQRQGCPECGKWKSGAARVCKQEHFLSKLSDDYKATYDLTLAIYQGLYSPVTVSCKEHGRFQVKPCDMYKGAGCVKCATSGFKIDIPAYLYVLQSDGSVKLGITNRKPLDRARRISSSSGVEHTVVQSFYFDLGSEARKLESTLLEILRKDYDNPRDVYDGYTESFVGIDAATLIEKIIDLQR
jgi:hypothetical protein